jgi:type IV secretion system protein VirB11
MTPKPNPEHDADTSSRRQRLHEKLRRDFGDVFMVALNDPRTIEILLNADGKLWQERLGEPMKVIGSMTATRAESVIRTIAACLDTTITRDKPTLEGELPLDGSRFAGQLPPIVSAPTFAVRKKASAVFTLEQYVDADIMTEGQREAICEAVALHKNILVIGGTGTGKTTLTNAIIQQIVTHDAKERIFIIEDTGEIQCVAANCVVYHTTLEVSMTKLLRTTLRMRPDRILVGEVRGPEALDLLMAWNTGHEGGVATLHANNALSGLSRLAMLISMHTECPKSIEPLIGEAVHIVIHIAKTPAGRRIQEILEVSGYADGRYQTRII